MRININKNNFRSAAVFLILTVLAGPAFGNTSAYEPLRPGAPGKEGRRTPIVAAIEKALPAVVSVNVKLDTGRNTQYRRDPFHDEFFDRFFGDMRQRRSRPSVSFGSGVIIEGDKNLVVTNEHVVRGAESITVTLTDGRELPAEIVGADARFDLAVLLVKSSKPLPGLKLGNSDELMIGETVIAIGNPFRLSHTATTGIVSATGRSIQASANSDALQDLIQTDASINPGNSGGPLINIDGEIIGINYAIRAGAEGLGFAIPSDKVKRIYARLARGEVGAQALDLGLELAEAGRPQKGETGLLVLQAKSGGPADKGGVKKGDMLMSLDGSPTATMNDYEVVISSLAPSQTVKAEVVRDNNTVALNLTPKAISEAEALDLAWRLYGLKAYESKGALTLERPADNSPAAMLGLREGDVLLRIGSTNITKKSDLAKAMIENRFSTSIALAVQRGRMIYQATLSR